LLTHGEPHPGNVMRSESGGWLMIDWDTAPAAPPERDLWDLTPGDGPALRPGLVELYRLRWDLVEVAGGLARLRQPHGATADDDETWADLEESATKVAP